MHADMVEVMRWALAIGRIQEERVDDFWQPEDVLRMATIDGARASIRLKIYLITQNAIVDALGQAVQRGVDVRLLLPGRTDVPILRHAAHGAYARLLRGGVRVFEYAPCILHAKTVVCDGHLAVIGSANLDFRSLWFNAECNLLLSDDATAATMERHFEHDLAESTEIVLTRWQTRGLWHRLGDAVARGLRVLL
jgi:cardiolipin synthase